MFLGCTEVMLHQTLNCHIGEQLWGMSKGGLELTQCMISMHSSASDGSKFAMNARPSFDDKTSVMIPTDSASSDIAAARALFHSMLKSTAIALTGGEGEAADGYTSES